MRTSERKSYLIWNVSPAMRKRLAKEANRRKLSLVDLHRQILSDKLGLEFAPGALTEGKTPPSRNAHFTLRVESELFHAFHAAAEAEGISARQFILQTLEEEMGK